LPSVTVLLAICTVLIFTSFTQYAEGATLSFKTPGCPTGFDPGSAQSGLLYKITYDDSGNPIYNDGKFDTKTISVNSTTEQDGIPLVLNETAINSGIFKNSNIIFMEGSVNLFPLNRGVTITVGNVAGTEPYNVNVVSDSDPIGIILPLHLSGTNGTTKFFSGQIFFVNGPSGGNSLQAKLGDVITVTDHNTHYTSSGLIVPNNKPTVGALSVNFLDTVTISYGGLSCTAQIQDELGQPGGGGGGLVIRPGFVLDLLASEVGGSPFIVSPPSFGGGLLHYSDGLTVVQNDKKITFDISKYNQDVGEQVLVAGKPVNMTLKMYDGYNINAIIHSGLYLIPRGSDMITPNSIASIVYDKGSKLEINDPTNLFSDVSVIPSNDGKFQYFKFRFVPTRSYEKMSFLDRSWNDHLYSTDVRFHDAGISQPKTNDMPVGFTKYDNYHDLISLIEKEGFKKPQILAHIHDTTDVFPSNEGGYVYWLHDVTAQSVTLVISDKEENTLFSFTQPLVANEIQPKADYGFMKFTEKQLNRSDHDEERKLMAQEAIKAMEKKFVPDNN
jgi:hypothetical protein